MDWVYWMLSFPCDDAGGPYFSFVSISVPGHSIEKMNSYFNSCITVFLSVLHEIQYETHNYHYVRGKKPN